MSDPIIVTDLPGDVVYCRSAGCKDLAPYGEAYCEAHSHFSGHADDCSLQFKMAPNGFAYITVPSWCTCEKEKKQ